MPVISTPKGTGSTSTPGESRPYACLSRLTLANFAGIVAAVPSGSAADAVGHAGALGANIMQAGELAW